MVNDIQLKANQQNAQLGGVKTPEGKAVSRFNAQTHGILRNSITEYEQGFFSEILDNLEAEYKPQGIIEQILIERIAINYLKLFRLQKAETEYIRSVLNPRIIINESEELIKSLSGKEEVVQEGYIPKVKSEAIEKLSDIYGRYETTIENRLFRALHELERAQKLRKGEKLLQPLAVDVNQVGSFGEINNNL